LNTCSLFEPAANLEDKTLLDAKLFPARTIWRCAPNALAGERPNRVAIARTRPR